MYKNQLTRLSNHGNTYEVVCCVLVRQWILVHEWRRSGTSLTGPSFTQIRTVRHDVEYFVNQAKLCSGSVILWDFCSAEVCVQCNVFFRNIGFNQACAKWKLFVLQFHGWMTVYLYFTVYLSFLWGVLGNCFCGTHLIFII